jgi:hypothetical protein
MSDEMKSFLIVVGFFLIITTICGIAGYWQHVERMALIEKGIYEQPR